MTCKRHMKKPDKVTIRITESILRVFSKLRLLDLHMSLQRNKETNYIGFKVKKKHNVGIQ